jgi:urea transporter
VWNMSRLLALAAPAVAVAALVLTLNLLDANAGIAVAAYGFVAVLTGGAIGYFANRLPELRSSRRPHRFASIHHGD